MLGAPSIKTVGPIKVNLMLDTYYVRTVLQNRKQNGGTSFATDFVILGPWANPSPHYSVQ